MAKYNSGNFLQVPRDLFNNNSNLLTWQARWLYVVLCELEHRFTNKDTDFFFRSTADLEKDSGMAPKTIRKYRAELENAEAIKTWRMHWRNPDGKLSEKSVMAFKLML